METLGKIINSVLSSLIVSIILFVGMYSLMTGEFPPNLARLKKSYSNLHEITRISRQIHEKDTSLRKKYQTTGEVDQSEVDALQELNLKRAELGTGLLNAGGDATVQLQEKRIEALEKRVAELESQLRRTAK